MRAALILLLLLLGMYAVLPLGQQGLGAESLLAFGFLILAATTVAEIAERVRLPHLVGYLFAGLLFGPQVLGTISETAVTRLEPVSELAISLIAFLAGAELKWRDLKERGGALARIIATELAFTFALIFLLTYGLRGSLPFLNQLPPEQALVFCLLFSATAVAHSPAVTLALLKETRAQGPVARSILTIVLVSDVPIVLLVTLAVTLARTIAPPEATGGVSLAGAAWEIGGAFIVGGLVGLAVATYLRVLRRDLVLFAIVITFLGSELAKLAHVEPLLTLIFAGFLAENVSRAEHGSELRHAMERSAAPVFVVFFALAGAKIDLQALITLSAVVVPVYLTRIVGIWLGTRVGARWAGLSPQEGRFLWTGLVSQAGVAIGLATVVADVYPTLGAQLRTMLLALIALNELTGPVIFRSGLEKAGEFRRKPRLRLRRERAIADHF